MPRPTLGVPTSPTRVRNPAPGTPGHWASICRFVAGFLGLLALTGCIETGSESVGAPVAREEAIPTAPGAGMPFLSSAGDTVYLSWIEPDEGSGHRLRMATRTPGGWSPARTVAQRDDFFVNWADFPSVQVGPDDALWTHWLQRGGDATYDYGVRVSRSVDGGTTWSEPWTPHEDGTPTEHGFVSFLPDGDDMALVWLDGRRFVPGDDGPATEEMALRYRTVTAGDEGLRGSGPETIVDSRTCDCCQTDAAVTSDGAVVVYRDRTEEEIRDIAVVRRGPDGWSEPHPVARDGWEIAGCPVNGPSVVARGDTVAVAWFTAADDQPRVRLAWSFDGGVSFPVVREVADEAPLGRVDLLLRDEGSVLVSWLEGGGVGASDRARVRIRALEPEGEATPAWTVATSLAGRTSGFPRLAEAGSGGPVLVAWTDADPDGIRGLRLIRFDPSPP